MASFDLDALAALDPRSLLYAQAKLTYVGLQSEPVSSVLFSVYTIAPRIEAFARTRAGVHYGNDSLPFVATFTVKHAAFQNFLGHLAETVRVHGEAGNWAAVAVMPDIRNGITHEALLQRTATEELLTRFMADLEPGYLIAQQVLGDFLRGP